MASSTLSSLWKSVEREEKGEIMKTNVFIKLVSDRHREKEMTLDIEWGFRIFREFALRFTRFESESELSRFNDSEGGQVSRELFSLLRECTRFHKLTRGVFDPSVLPTLEKIGYGTAGHVHDKKSASRYSFQQLVFDADEQSVHKPRDLRVDIGGIGKGYIVDKVADQLSKKYAHGIVDAGGDMRVFGSDWEQGLKHWAIDVENPLDISRTLTTLLLSNCAVATSGINRKQWKKEGKTHHHLIDPEKETSAQTGLISVTVVTLRATEADVLAKTLFILGLVRGQAFAKERDIPALFVTENGDIMRNALFQKYEWKA